MHLALFQDLQYDETIRDLSCGAGSSGVDSVISAMAGHKPGLRYLRSPVSQRTERQVERCVLMCLGSSCVQVVQVWQVWREMPKLQTRSNKLIPSNSFQTWQFEE